ncbi:MAG TPA: Hsp20/alpha crystallin family protein [Ktedonobacterales bacterium]
MSISRREPFEALTPLRDAMNRLFEDSFVSSLPGDWFGRSIQVDIRETDKMYVIEAAMPGFKPEDITITVSGDLVTLSGAKKEEKSSKEGAYVRRERSAGEITRTFRLPEPFNPDKVTATYEHGILTLELPKAEHAKAKKIPVTTSGDEARALPTSSARVSAEANNAAKS